MLSVVLQYFLLILPALVSVAFLILSERKVLSFVNLRMGPEKVSFLGILQSLGDAVKLLNKQYNHLSNFSFFFYYFSSASMILMAISMYFFFPCFPAPLLFKYSLFCFFVVLAFNTLISIISGWSVYNKFSLIGSLRTVSQLISYEAALFVCFFFFISVHNSVSFSFYMLSVSEFPFLFFLMITFLIWLPCVLAELNRTPYDFSEGESELVSGFNTDFGSTGFTLIFLSEYSNILFFSILSCILFSYPLFFLPVFLFIFFILWIRSVLPRYRFDKLMLMCWKIFIPLLTLIFLFYLIFSCS